MHLKYKPALDYMIVQPEKPKEVSEGGIFIPAMAQKTLHEGKIIRLGPDCSKHFQLGQFVVYTPHSESLFNMDGEVLAVLKETAVLVYRDTEEPPHEKFFKTKPISKEDYERMSRVNPNTAGFSDY